MPDGRVSPWVILAGFGAAAALLYGVTSSARAAEVAPPVQPEQLPPPPERPEPVIPPYQTPPPPEEEIPPAAPRAALPPIVNPDDLNKIVQAASRDGSTMFPFNRATVLAPAGNQVTLELTLPPNFVDTRMEPLTISSDYYGNDIIVDVYADSYDRRVTPDGIRLTGETRINFGQYYLKNNSVILVVTNNSSLDATITYEIQPALLHRTVYEDWYRPIIDYSMRQLGEVSEYMGGSRI